MKDTEIHNKNWHQELSAALTDFSESVLWQQKGPYLQRDLQRDRRCYGSLYGGFLHSKFSYIMADTYVEAPGFCSAQPLLTAAAVRTCRIYCMWPLLHKSSSCANHVVIAMLEMLLIQNMLGPCCGTQEGMVYVLTE